MGKLTLRLVRRCLPTRASMTPSPGWPKRRWRKPAGNWCRLGYLWAAMWRWKWQGWPRRVSGAMALFSTNCRQDNDAQRAYREQAIKLAQQDGFRGVTRQFLGKFLSPKALADTALVDGVLAMAADIGRVTFARQQHAILGRRAQHDTLASLNVPLSIVCGINDTLTPPALISGNGRFGTAC